MDFLNEFNRIMENTLHIALATSVKDVPNVRLLNFYYDTQRKVVFVTTFKGSPKAAEFLENDNIALTTVPVGSSEHVRINGTVKKSDLAISEYLDICDTKYHGIKEMLSKGKDTMGVYEVHFNEAEVIINMQQRGKIAL